MSNRLMRVSHRWPRVIGSSRSAWVRLAGEISNRLIPGEGGWRADIESSHSGREVVGGRISNRLTPGEGGWRVDIESSHSGRGCWRADIESSHSGRAGRGAGRGGRAVRRFDMSTRWGSGPEGGCWRSSGVGDDPMSDRAAVRRGWRWRLADRVIECGGAVGVLGDGCDTGLVRLVWMDERCVPMVGHSSMADG